MLRGVVGSAPAWGAGSHMPQLRHGADKYIFKKRERERQEVQNGVTCAKPTSPEL